MRNRSDWLVAALLLGLAAPLTLKARAATLQVREKWPPEADNLYLPSARALAAASLGHRELFADLIAARTNVYFGDQMQTRGRQRWLSYYLNTVADLDPRFHPIYMRGAAMLLYAREGKVSLEDALRSAAFLRRGLEQFRDDWELYFQLGFSLFFEVPQAAGKADPRIPAWKREGVEMLRKATLFEGIPPFVASAVANMMTRTGERQLAIQHLEQSFAATSDPEARQQIQAKLRQLVGEQYAEEYEMRARRLERIVETRYPYADEAFSLIAGRRFSPLGSIHDLGQDPADRPAPDDAAPTPKPAAP